MAHDKTMIPATGKNKTQNKNSLGVRHFHISKLQFLLQCSHPATIVLKQQ